MTAHPTSIRGELLELRVLTTADAPAMTALRQADREHFRHAEPERGEEWYTLEGQRAALAHAAELHAEGARVPFGMFVGVELVGWITISSIEHGPFQNAHLGYSVASRSCGRGYATEAVRLAVQYAFEHLGLHRVQAATLPDNEASMRVLLRNGFREEGYAYRYLHLAGEWRDHRIFARLADDPPVAAGPPVQQG